MKTYLYLFHWSLLWGRTAFPASCEERPKKEVRGEAEETADSVNVAHERESPLAFCRETEETYRNKIEAKAPGMVTHIMKLLSVVATESQSLNFDI
jgi:hypothetical protein